MQSHSTDINHSLLRIYSYYRAALGSILLLIYYSGIAPYTLGHENRELFIITASAFTLLNVLALFALWLGRFAAKTERIFAILLIDIVAITLIIHSSGGMGNGLSFLLLICIATGGILLSRQLSFVVAALASLILIAETVYNINLGISENRTLFSAGSLGTIMFIAAFSFSYLSMRLRQSSREAATQAAHARHLERIAQSIVERMQTGVVVCAANGDVEVINKSAKNFLNWHGQSNRNIGDVPPLHYQLQSWKHDPAFRPSSEDLDDNVRMSFSKLDPDSDAQTVIFLEDNKSLTREAQQLKQASLGRLTASIAHEIRNPLGAISHAGQLLSESPSLDPADKRLTEIIETHSKRVNQIIENIMQISRGSTPQPETVNLNDWLPQFVEDYKRHCEPNADIELQIVQNETLIRMDLSQLHQVLRNLCDNGLRHGHKITQRQHLKIRANVDRHSSLPYIEVLDDGEGIAEDKLTSVFEPFFTTEASGSGLGLYLSKALCEANHASLEYKPNSGLSCFKLTFAHPNRMY